MIDPCLIDALGQTPLPVQGKRRLLELRRRGYNNALSIFYYRTADGKEVDLLLRNGHITTDLIQVCLNMSASETRDREANALAAACRDHPRAQLTILTANESGTIAIADNRQIRLTPVYEFCR
jgi:predicted AAA+ superfamily ATPase